MTPFWGTIDMMDQSKTLLTMMAYFDKHKPQAGYRWTWAVQLAARMKSDVQNRGATHHHCSTKLARRYKNLSHLGGYLMDYVLSELSTRAGKTRTQWSGSYSPVKNYTYAELRRHCLTHQPQISEFWSDANMLSTQDEVIGDMCETAAAIMLGVGELG